MQVGRETSIELLKFCEGTLLKCALNMGQKKTVEDIVLLKSELIDDLNRTYHNLTFSDVTEAFRVGVRVDEDRFAIIPKTWCRWLDAQRKKNGAKSNKLFKANELAQIEYKSANTDHSASHRNYILNVLVTNYEEWLNFVEPKNRFGNQYQMSGIEMQFKWFAANKFIIITPEDSAALRKKLRSSIKHEAGSYTTAKYKLETACKEYLISELYKELKEGKVNLREQALEILNE